VHSLLGQHRVRGGGGVLKLGTFSIMAKALNYLRTPEGSHSAWR